MKSLKSMKWILFAMMTIGSTELSYATIAKFSMVPQTPTTLTVPKNQIAYVRYEITNNTKITRTLTMADQVPGISQVTTGNRACSNPFTLASQGSCLFTLELNGSQLPVSVHIGPTICKTISGSNNQPDSLVCSQPSLTNRLSISSPPPAVRYRVAYVSNFTGNSISICDVNNTSGLLENCAIAATGGTISNPEAVATNSDVSLLYIANVGNSTVSVCQIDSSTGLLTQCQATGSGFAAPSGIVTDLAQSYALVSNITNDSVSSCLISGSGELTNCVTTGSNFDYTSDIAMTPDQAFVYAGNFDRNSLTICTNSFGTLSSCTETAALFNNPEGVTINSAGTFAYVTNNGSDNISLCSLSNGGGTLDSCSITNGTFHGFGNLAFNDAGTLAYVPSSTTALSMCLVDQSTGALSNCGDSGAGSAFNDPAGVLITTLPK